MPPVAGNLFTRLYPGTSQLYWSFLGLNLAGQVSYMVRDAYRNEAVVPDHRYLDYAIKGFIGAVISTYAFELGTRASEALYFGPAAARHALQFDTELAKNYKDPVTLAEGSSAKNLSTLSKAKYTLGKMSGSFANMKANPELADNLIHDLLHNPHLIPKKERAAVIHFWRKRRFFQASDSNVNHQHDDFLKLVVDKDHHNKKLLNFFKPGSIHHLSTQQLNVLRDQLLQHQLIEKVLKACHTKPEKGKSKLNIDHMRYLFKTRNLNEWLDNEIKISEKFKHSLKQPKTVLKGMESHLKDTVVKEFDGLLKSQLNSFNYFVKATIVDGNKETTRTIINPELAKNKVNNLRRVINFVQSEIKRPTSKNDIIVHKYKLLELSDGIQQRMARFLEEPLEALKPNEKDLAKLKQYLHEGFSAHKAKKLLSRINKHDFFVKMGIIIAFQFFAFGLFTTIMDVDVAQPLQKELTAQGIRPDKVSRWPIYTGIIPGALSFMAMMSNPIMKRIPVVGKKIVGMDRLSRFITTMIPSAGLTAAYMVTGVKRNIRKEKAKALATHQTHRPVPTGSAEAPLLGLGYNTFAQRVDNPAVPNPFAKFAAQTAR